MIPRPPRFTLLPYTTLFLSSQLSVAVTVAGAEIALHSLVTSAGQPCNTGTLVSTTVTIWVQLAALPQAPTSVQPRRLVLLSRPQLLADSWLVPHSHTVRFGT